MFQFRLPGSRCDGSDSLSSGSRETRTGNDTVDTTTGFGRKYCPTSVRKWHESPNCPMVWSCLYRGTIFLFGYVIDEYGCIWGHFGRSIFQAHARRNLRHLCVSHSTTSGWTKYPRASNIFGFDKALVFRSMVLGAYICFWGLRAGAGLGRHHPT